MANFGENLYTVPNIWTKPLQRQNDTYIMHILLQDPHLSHKQLHCLSCCRLYLRVTQLSDITSSDGNTIPHHFLTGIQRNQYTTLQWPVQQAPQPFTWKMWEKVISHHFLQGNSLRRPLGQWYTYTNKYQWYYSPVYESVLSQQNCIWKKFSTTITRRYIRWKLSSTEIHKPPVLYPLTEVSHLNDNCLRSLTPIIQPSYHPPPFPPTWHSSQYEKYSMFHIHPTQTTYSISTTRAQLQLSDTLHIVCHGGLHDQFGYNG